MKNSSLWLLSGTLVLLPACAFHDARLSIQPVGPGSAVVNTSAGTGYLVVYSAWSPFNNYNTFDHSGYDVLSNDGRKVEHVPNHIAGNFNAEPPSLVSLPAGSYEIRAVSEDYGRVTVPVVIDGGKTTRVYLDCESQPQDLRSSPANTVRLPDGQIVGWAAEVAANQERN